MKNKLYVILLLALIAVSCILLCGCNHKHSFGEWQIETPPTCTQPGTKVSYCRCGDKQIAPVEPTHQFDSNTGRCIVCKEKCNHKYNAQGTCTYCGFTNKNYCTEHIWDSEYGYCLNCGEYCAHKFDNNYHCEVCDFACLHRHWTKGICDTCGKQCDHEWSSENEQCDICNTKCEHQFSDSGLCSVCNHQCPHNNWSLGVCDKCSMVCSHNSYAYGVCSMCNSGMDSQLKQNCTHNFEKGLCTICGTQDASASTSKTYNLAESSLPVSWNVLDSQAELDQLVTTYTEDSLYVFDYNDDKTGYQIVPAMALSMPIEVPLTAELAQKWGFEADENGNYPQHHIWKIPLRTDLKFDNGDPITAQTYVQTLHRLLNKDANYNNVHNLYASLVVIKNIEKYLRQNQDIVHSASNLYTSWDDATNAHADDLVFSIENSYIGNWLYSLYGIGYINQYDGYNGLYSTVVGVDRELLDALTGKTWTEISADAELTSKWNTVLASWNPAPNEELHFFIVEDKTEAITLEQVGIYAENDHTLVLVLDKPLDSLVLVSQLKLPLVHIETYDSCTKVENGVFTTTYGTSVDTYVGYGPYKLTVYQEGTVLQFTRNQHWYNNPKNIVGGSPYYQATGIVIRQITNPELAFQMFLRGELDKLDLDPYNVEENYGNPNVYYQDEASTWFLTMSPNEEALQFRQENTSPVNEGYVVNKTVITIKEFRQALSYSLDRLQYILALGYEAIPQVGILGPATVADQYSGEIYRLTEQGKDNLLAYWGLTNQVCTDSCTDGCTTHKFATKDDALDSITGCNLEQAKQLFDKAYDIAVEKQLIPADALASGKWEVKLTIAFGRVIHDPESTQSFNQLVSIWKQAVKGTKFEGHLEFTQCPPLGLSYRDYLRNNEIDILLDYGWSSYLLYPIASLDLFIDPQFKYESIWDTTTEQLEIELPLNAQGQYDPNGTPAVVSGTVYDWRCLLSGEQKTFTVLDGTDQSTTITLSASDPQHSAMRITILSCLENAILQQYNVIKICGTVNAHMISHCTSYPTDQYVYGIGYGGLKYLQFSMTDAEWAQAVANNGGSWDYSK